MKTSDIIKQAFFYLVGVVFLIGFFTIAGLLTVTVVPDQNKEMVGGIVETLKNGSLIILGYWYGSSKGSADKTDLMNGKSQSQ